MTRSDDAHETADVDRQKLALTVVQRCMKSCGFMTVTSPTHHLRKKYQTSLKSKSYTNKISADFTQSARHLKQHY